MSKLSRLTVLLVPFLQSVVSCSGPSSSGITLPMSTGQSECFVGDLSVRLNILIPVEYDKTGREERVLWTMICTSNDWPTCKGVALVVSEIEELGEVTGYESYGIHDAQVIDSQGQTVVIEWHGGTIEVDAAAGTARFEGLLFGSRRGSGQADCAQYGPIGHEEA